METRITPPPQASARQTEMGDTFNRVLFAAIDALQDAKIPYALIGGIAVSGMGRPRSTHDIDIFVRPEDAEATLEALAQAGFETERTDLRWLFKGWLDEMMVDIIFKSQGDIYFDTEMHEKARLIHYHGRDIPVVAPEDLVIIKAVVHSEIGPHHWHDALAILSHATLDWQYLIKRARRAPRRLLALLIYAQSNDILIPNQVIHDLYSVIFSQSTSGANPSAPATQAASTAMPQPTPATPQPSAAVKTPVSVAQVRGESEVYLIGHVLDRLASDSRSAAADIQVTVGAGKLLMKGETSTSTQRLLIEDVVRELALGLEIDNQLRLTEIAPPEAQEVV